VHDARKIGGVPTADRHAIAIAEQLSGQPTARFTSGIQHDDDFACGGGCFVDHEIQ
jgi:hypothetical protein